MSVQVEKLEHNMAKLTIEVEASKFDAAMKKAYNKKKGSFNLPGFRKGKVPMYIIEKEYGAGVFYEDAANELMPEAYAAALEESGLEVVSRPEVDVTQIGKGQNFIFTAEVAVKPEVKLGEYKGLDVQMDSVEVADEEVEAKLKEAQEQNAREITVEDRAVQDGDIITLNYAGTVDGVAFDGGTAENQQLVIGSHTFIDNFEEQLIGVEIGGEKDVEVTFPEEYHAPDLLMISIFVPISISVPALEIPSPYIKSNSAVLNGGATLFLTTLTLVRAPTFSLLALINSPLRTSRRTEE